VIDALDIRKHFSSIVSASDVINSKPDPETFLLNAKQLSVDPGDCIVFEDAPKGVEAAERAGMSCVVITTMHPATDFHQYTNVKQFINDYSELIPSLLIS
jgi:beta-phosphoglucomutase-like phosphatase (HAD superfamily)